MFKKILSISIQWQHALALVLFFLPWQTRFIVHQTILQGGVWEYGTLGIYVTEVLLWGAAVWFVTFRVRAIYAASVSESCVNLFMRMRTALRAHKKIYLCIGFFVAWYVYHMARAQFPWVEAQALIHIFGACILWYLITRAHTQARFLQWSFLAGIGAQALLALAQFVTQNAFASRLLGMAAHPAWAGGSAVIETAGGRWLRAYGGLPHPNILGGYMAIGALLIAIQIVRMPREKTMRDAFKVSAALLFFILLASGLIVSFSRSALLAFLCGLIIVIGRAARERLSNGWRACDIARRVGIIVLSAGLAAGIFIALVPDIFSARANGQTRLEQQSISGRIESYKGAREVLRRKWLWGTGLGNYTAAIYALDSTRPGWEYQPVHNALVLAFLEFGLLMSIVVIWFLFSFFRTKFLAGDGELLIPLIVVAMFDHYLWSLWSGLALCAVVFAFLRAGKIKDGLTA